MNSGLQWLLQSLWLLRPAKRKLVILDSISGILKPGRLTLLLGPPSSGKSTLLKALAGQPWPSGLKVLLPPMKHTTYAFEQVHQEAQLWSVIIHLIKQRRALA